MDDILPFTPAQECNGIQLLLVTGIYGTILFQAAGLIGDGSELLLLVPALADIVGSIVLPVLGAVPDGVMVLCSGLGERMSVQSQVTVGVGALAGSTVMLLTAAWFAGIYGGRVNIRNGKPDYMSKPKLFPAGNKSPTGTGVNLSPQINKNAKVMMATTLLYLIVQLPVCFIPGDEVLAEKAKHSGETVFDVKADAVNTYALFGTAACFAAFIGYLYLQMISGGESEQGAEYNSAATNVKALALTCQRQVAIKHGDISLRGVMYGLLEEQKGSQMLLDISDRERGEMKKILRPFFDFYDADKSRHLSRIEFAKILYDLNEPMDSEKEENLFRQADVDDSGSIDFNEFVALMIRYLKDASWEDVRDTRFASAVHGLERLPTPRQTLDDGGHESEEEEEEDEMPEDLRMLSPAEQQAAVKSRACMMMGFGTILVLVFSDPAVEVLNEIGIRTGIPSFYISFVLAPLASNASELVAAYRYGCKKTTSAMTISLATLEGAACMNNTFCLFIFYALIYFQRLCWEFSAEVISIILVQFGVGVFALKSFNTLYDGYMIAAMFPASLALVWVLNNICGMK